MAAARALYDLAARRAEGELMSGRDAMLLAGPAGPQRGVRTRWATGDQARTRESQILYY